MPRKKRRLRVKFPLSSNGRERVNVNNQLFGNSCNSVTNLTFNSVKFQLRHFGLLFFRILPPVRSYRNVKEALLRLNNLNNTTKDEEGYEFKFSTLKIRDTGFKELVAILKEDLSLSGKVDELRIIEETAGLGVGPSAKVNRMLVAIIDGKEEVIVYIPFDPRRPMRELKEMGEKVLRKSISIILIYLLFVWLLLALLILQHAILH